MTTDGSRPIRPTEERSLDDGQCYWCGEPAGTPDELIAIIGNPMHQSYVLVLRRPCCHGRVSTEHWGTVLNYLCDGWARAQLICRLYNAHAGLPERPDQPRPDQPTTFRPTA